MLYESWPVLLAQELSLKMGRGEYLYDFCHPIDRSQQHEPSDLASQFVVVRYCGVKSMLIFGLVKTT